MTNPDADIMIALRSNDSRALDLIYARFGRLIATQVLLVVGSARVAEDIEQEVYVTIAQRRGQIVHARDLTSYLLTLARNQALSAVRRRSREFSQPSLPDLVAPSHPEADEEGAKRISVALMALPLEQRQVVVMKVWEGQSFPEIAAVIGVSANTITSRFRYACEKLRGLLRDSHD